MYLEEIITTEPHEEQCTPPFLSLDPRTVLSTERPPTLCQYWTITPERAVPNYNRILDFRQKAELFQKMFSLMYGTPYISHKELPQRSPITHKPIQDDCLAIQYFIANALQTLPESFLKQIDFAHFLVDEETIPERDILTGTYS